MTSLTKRTTIYLDPALHQALRLKSAETAQSISQLINDSVRHALLEDDEDLQAFRDRADEPTLSYEALLTDLKANGKL